MIYPIVLYGDPVLKKLAENIAKGSIDIKQLSEDMFETMYQANGVGLAAPQIGKSLRMFVVDSGPLEEEDEEQHKGFKRVFVNPEILELDEEEWAYEEGCLSIPGLRADVFRPFRVKINYFDENWEEHTETLDDMPARIVLHEYDHIEGILFTDHVSGLKKRLMKGKLNNISQGKKIDADYKVKLPPKLAKK
jgi:peptide deformylase